MAGKADRGKYPPASGKIVRGRTTTYSVSVPTISSKYITEVAALAGVSESTFVAMALMRGAKAIHKDIAPEKFVPESVWKMLSEMGLDLAKAQAGEKHEKS